MRRKVEVFKENVNTSFFYLDSFFSWLPLPPAARGLFLKKPSPGPRQKLLINKVQMTTATDLHKTNTRQQKFLLASSCNFVAKN